LAAQDALERRCAEEAGRPAHRGGRSSRSAASPRGTSHEWQRNPSGRRHGPDSNWAVAWRLAALNRAQQSSRGYMRGSQTLACVTFSASWSTTLSRIADCFAMAVSLFDEASSAIRIALCQARWLEAACQQRADSIECCRILKKSRGKLARTF